MKNSFKYILALLLVIGITSQTSFGKRITTLLQIGDGQIRWNNTDGVLEFANDKTSFLPLGSGSGGSGGINLLENEGFEQGLSKWTNTGGTLTSESYTNSTTANKKYVRFVATGSGQYFESELRAIPDSLGIGCMADLNYFQGDNAFDYEVIDNNTDTLASGSVSDLSNGWQKAPTLTMSCPDAGDSYKLRITSTAAGTIDVDNAYLGSNKGFIQGENHAIIQSYTPTFQGFGTVTSDQLSFIHSGNRLKVWGTFQTGSHTGSIIQFNLPIGLTIKSSTATYNHAGTFTVDQSVSSKGGFILASNGNGFVNLSAISIFGSLTDNPLSPAVGTDHTSSRTYAVEFEVFVNEVGRTGSQEAFVPEQADFHIYSKIASTAGQAVGIGLNTVPNESTLTITNYLGSQASITCTGGNPSGNPSCPTGNGQLGIEFNAPVAGVYRVCTSFSSGFNFPLYMIETSLNSDTAIQTGINSNYRNISSQAEHFCNSFHFSSAGAKSIKLLGGSANVSPSAQIYTENQSSTGTRGVVFEVQLLQNNVSRPVIQNMVDTSNKDGLRIESCTIDDSGTSTFVTDDCNSWIDSLTETGVGLGEIDIKTGIFSNPPSCSFASVAANGCASHSDTLNTISKITWELRSCSGASAAQYRFSIVCSGKR